MKINHDRSRLPLFTSWFLVFLLIMALLPFTLPATPPVKAPSQKPPLKIFCIGDSITEGYGLKDADGKQAMAKLGYPAKLGEILVPQATVKHYGAGGTTYFRNGPHPFEKTAWFAYFQLAKPDIVTIAFGTNCSGEKAWPLLHEQYTNDVKWLIARIREENPTVAIYICLPPPAYSGMWGISEPTIRDQIIPALREIAEEEHCLTIDLHTALSHHPELFFDTIHPNEEGMKLIARTIADRLYETRKDLIRPQVSSQTMK